MIPWYLWVFQPKKNHKAITFYFLSRRYGTSPRFFPLFNEFDLTQIILFRGSRFVGVDRIYLKFIPIFIIIFKKRLAAYKNFVTFNSSTNCAVATNTILNIDDPSYSSEELKQLHLWENKIFSLGYESVFVCTSEYMKAYFESHALKSRIVVIPQGHGNRFPISTGNNGGSDALDFVYISPTIDAKGDRHENHKMWDASTLLFEIWPKVTDPKARLHLIGKLGGNACSILEDSRVISYGLMSIEDCSAILPQFHVALYPRVHDNGWMPQKLIEYLGAGLPVIAFKMIDTQIVAELGIGTLVSSVEDFALTMAEYVINPDISNNQKAMCSKFAENYSWKSLAKRFENIYF